MLSYAAFLRRFGRLTMGIKEIILNALFPDKVVCCSCGREAVVSESGLCRDCGMGLEMFNSAPPIENIEGYTAAYIYNDVSGSMVKRLKYNNARYIAKILADAVKIPEEWDVDVVVPIPLHYKRLAKRGYNQSELIAKHIAARLGLKLDTTMVVRRMNTKQQAKLTEAGRKRNLKDAFIADDRCGGVSILLVDDVRTTGATLSECARALKNCGCRSVYAATVCFANYEKGGSV